MPKSATTKGSRHLVLLRHGHYDLSSLGHLTEIGREQAKLTAPRLASISFDAVWSSTLVRAKETAAIVGSELGFGAKATSLLREGMYTKLEGYDVTQEERRADRERAEKAFRKFFSPSKKDRTELLVCHGNLIRYFVCRAMGVSFSKWVKLNSHHCALTRIVVRGTGAVRVVSYNETGHLPEKLVT